MRRLKIYILILAVLPIHYSCVTKKKRDEVSKVGKMYHNITSKYNRNFNANLLIDETLAQLDVSYQDDYSEILPIYPYADKENPTLLAEPMDRAIEKVSVAIALHRPSHWTDDNYLIIGRAQYLKEDFESAEATLRYLVKHYDPNNLIAASAQKSRNVNKKLTDREKTVQKKEAAKERDEKVKQRKKDIKKSAKEREKKAKQDKLARVKKRKQEIKDREKLAKSSTPKTTSPVSKSPDVAQAPDSKKKKQKPFDENPQLPKIKGNPDNYFMKHKPVHQEAQLWLAKTLIERDRFGEAENILRTLDGNANVFKEIKEEIYPVQAHSALSRGQIASAVEPLTKAVEITSNRILRARYAYILAQVLERTNRYNDALAAYDQVIKLRPDYEMNFSAQLSKLKMQSSTGNIEPEKYADVLNRMIKDDKNREYQDQLYFALAQYELKRGNKTEAIANLTASIRNNAGNQVQQSESYLTLAELYFDDDDFVKAKFYFDSTQAVMSKADTRYEMVTSHSKNLTKIASNLQIIDLQDSLIRISQLSDKELKALASEIKKKAAQEEAAAKAAATQEKAPGNNIPTLNVAPQNVALGQQGGSVFFAYDDRTLKKGQRDFNRIWGEVSLQDNWRRSSSAAFGIIASESTGEPLDSSSVGISETEIDEIFKNVPKTPEQLEASKKKIEDALFGLGQLFRSELSNSSKSVESLDQLLERFPSTEHALDAYYLLFVDHTELGNNQEATYYSKKITEEFADSEYAKYISDPNYLRDALTDDEKAEQYYKGVHSLFEKGQYDQALKQLLQARSTLPAKHNLLSKFSFLTAMCIGKLQGREQYVNALKETIAKYPKTQEEERAKEIIRLLGIRFTETNEGIEEINAAEYFTLTEEDKLHMVVVVLKKEADGQERNEARVKISDYNKKFHNLDKLTISMILLGENNDLPMLVIRRFDTRENAMAYYDGVQKNVAEFLGDPTRYEIYAASQTNYRKIVQLKSVDIYRDFFVKEYLAK